LREAFKVTFCVPSKETAPADMSPPEILKSLAVCRRVALFALPSIEAVMLFARI
jgi:hypothetical protein